MAAQVNARRFQGTDCTTRFMSVNSSNTSNGHSPPTRRIFRTPRKSSRKQDSLFRAGSLEDSSSSLSSSSDSLNSQSGEPLNIATPNTSTFQNSVENPNFLCNRASMSSALCCGSTLVSTESQTDHTERVLEDTNTTNHHTWNPEPRSSSMTDTNFTEWLIKCSCKHMSVEQQMSRETESELDKYSLSPKCKTVHFADTCGKVLLHVLSFENFQEADFTVRDSSEDLRTFYIPASESKSFAPLFFLPPSNTAFLEKTREQKVKLESIQIFGTNVLGSVLVANLGFHKEVCIRYSLDSWATSLECGASYVTGASFQDCDRFSFNMTFVPAQIRDKVVFCVRYKCAAGEFWDNNQGLNYSLKLLSI